jgi:Fur family ferric uptake transcriptional regulator
MSAAPETAQMSFRQYLRSRGLAFTHQRRLVLDELLRRREHFDVERLVWRMQRRGVPVSRATVYRTVAHLERSGIIRRIRRRASHAEYEFLGSRSHHEHLLCEDCGRVIEFCDEDLEAHIQEAARRSGFRMTRHVVQIYGLCSECRQARDNETN